MYYEKLPGICGGEIPEEIERNTPERLICSAGGTQTVRETEAGELAR
jgi:hypothetical protein